MLLGGAWPPCSGRRRCWPPPGVFTAGSLVPARRPPAACHLRPGRDGVGARCCRPGAVHHPTPSRPRTQPGARRVVLHRRRGFAVVDVTARHRRAGLALGVPRQPACRLASWRRCRRGAAEVRGRPAGRLDLPGALLFTAATALLCTGGPRPRRLAAPSTWSGTPRRPSVRAFACVSAGCVPADAGAGRVAAVSPAPWEVAAAGMLAAFSSPRSPCAPRGYDPLGTASLSPAALAWWSARTRQRHSSAGSARGPWAPRFARPRRPALLASWTSGSACGPGWRPAWRWSPRPRSSRGSTRRARRRGRAQPGLSSGIVTPAKSWASSRVAGVSALASGPFARRRGRRTAFTRAAGGAAVPRVADRAPACPRRARPARARPPPPIRG